MGISNLAEKITAVVLPIDSLNRPFRQKQGQVQQTPFEFIREEYGSRLLVGLSVDLTKPEELFKLRQENKLKKIKMLRFRLQEQHFP